jgi:hypothetical protein
MTKTKPCSFCGGPILTDAFFNSHLHFRDCADYLKQRNAELRNKVERMVAGNAMHCEQYNAGVDAAKAGKVYGPRPEFDTSTWYDGYAATMLPVLRERIAELEAEKERTCAWKIDEDGVYWTLCDNAHEFIIGGPNENYFEFCPYCGKRLIVVEVNDCEYLKGGE